MKKSIFLMLCMLVSICGYAQKTVTGTVVDKSDIPVIGASVLEVGNPSNGTITDMDGNFTLSVKSNGELQISYIGYVTQVVKVENRKTIRVVLDEDSKALDEVVVVAFGKMKKEAFTGSAGVMKTEELAKAQVSNAANALAGRVAGLQMSTTSAQMGESPSITIRGIGSISSGTEPLVVVDGMPYDGNLNLINPQDIESMTVLKDAASNALYGARGANGVIMITTKRGASGDAKITFDAKWGVNSNGLKNYKSLNAQQFYETYYKSLYNYAVASTEDTGLGYSAAEAHAYANNALMNSSSGLGPGYMIYTVPTGQDFILEGGKMNPKATMGAMYNYDGTQLWLTADDWEKEGLMNGFRQEYNATVSGASDRINYYASLGYLDQEGIQEGARETRITARLKADYQAKKWLKVGVNMGYTDYDYAQVSEGTIGGGSIWATIKTQAPIYPVYFRGADKQIMIDQWGEPMYDFAQKYDLNRGGGVGGNGIFSNKYRDSNTYGGSFTGSGYADFNIMEGLTFTVNGSIYKYDRRYTYVNSPFVDNYTSSNDNGSVSKGAYSTKTYNTQQLLNYVKTFGLHDVSAMIGHEYYNYRYESLSGSGWNFGIDGTTELNALLNLNYPGSYSTNYNNEGYFFRGMYSYDSKYYGSLSFRRDASSRFHKDHRWGNFWSAGGAWVISKEDFFDVDWIDMLKFKASIGSQGNDNIGTGGYGYYYYADSYDIVNNNNEVAYQWKQKGTKDITWETNTNINAGFEFDLLKGRLSGSIDYFYRKTSDMLFSLNTPPSVGYTSYFVNLGDMRNQGVELVLNATPIRNKNWNWDVNFNISYMKNKVLKLPEAIKTTTVEGYNGYVNLDGSFVSKFCFFVAEDLPLYSVYYPKSAGINKETGAALYWKDVKDENGKVTGKEKIEDYSQATKYLLGDAMPAFSGGWGTSLKYKNFDLSINTNFQIGGLVRDYTYNTLMHSGGGSTNWHVDILNSWTPENKNSNIPRLRYTEKYSQNGLTDRFFADASYWNIQNVNFGYTLPKSVVEKMGMTNMRVFFSGENLFYISARQGLDPRQSLNGVQNPEMYSPMRTISGGVSLTF